MAFRAIVVLCALALPMTNAVINTKTEPKIERREAFQTYGPPPIQAIQPQQQTIVLPAPVYGVPAVNKYPPPTPERPPPLPAKEYGVPVRQYGPPKVQIHTEYGPPPAQSHQQIQTNTHHHRQVINHGNQNSLSFLDQIKETFGFGSSSSSHASHTSYGPPPQAPVNHFPPPKVFTKYGPPPKPQFISKPITSYGPPPSTQYGPPKPVYQAPAVGPLKQFYGAPIKPAVNFKPQQTYGLPPTPLRQPLPAYGPPQLQLLPLSQPHSIPSFPKLVKGAGCDGWKPISGSSFGAQSIGHSSSSSIASIQPENSYLPPQSNHLPSVETTIVIQPDSSYLPPSNTIMDSTLTLKPADSYGPPPANSVQIADAILSVQPLPSNLQLPVAEATNFHSDANLGSNIASGLGLTSINLVKSEGIELPSNYLDAHPLPPVGSYAPDFQKKPEAIVQSLDSYSLPPADSFAPNFQKSPAIRLTPPSKELYPYSSSSSFKQYPIHVSAPRHPVSFRPPVPQGLLESIGQSVKHQDQFGVKIRHQPNNVYLPPPTNEVPPLPAGLESLPLAPAVPLHSGASNANHFDQQFIYAPSPCSHGPNFSGGNLGSGSSAVGSIPQLQTVYGVPHQALDVSQSSSFEIAQNAGPQGLLTSYGPPASGSATNYNSFVNTREEHAPLSSYGPPPSGNPSDSYAHGSQKSFHTVKIDSVSNASSNQNDTQISTLPGLSSSGLDILSAQKSIPLEIPVQGQLGSYSLQFQAADPLASQNNEIDRPDHQKLLSEGLLQSILSAIEQPKATDAPNQLESTKESLDNHPDVTEFVKSSVGQDTLSEVKAE